jgi:hypothetical protein
MAGSFGDGAPPGDSGPFAGDGRPASFKRAHGATGATGAGEVFGANSSLCVAGSFDGDEGESGPAGPDGALARRTPWPGTAADGAQDNGDGSPSPFGLGTFLAVKHEPNNGALRFFFKDRDDAIIVDTPVEGPTSDETYVVQGSNVAVRIRNGFHPQQIDRWKREDELRLSLQPVRIPADGPPDKSGRVPRGAELKRTLIRLFQASQAGAAFAEPEQADLGFRWKGFPVRPPPRRARLYVSVAQQHAALPMVLSARPRRPMVVCPTPQKPVRAPHPPVRVGLEPRIVDIGVGLHLPPHIDSHRM